MSGLTRWEPTTRWNPFKEIEEMEKRLSSLFGRTSVPTGGDKKEAITVAEWSPLVDISEDDKEYLIKAEVPEMKKEEIKINVHDDVLAISGERKYEKEEKGNGEKVLRSERYYGMVSRTFSLADDIDEAKVEAKYADGVLTLKLPKKSTAEAKKIAIQ